jgi:hypothetical protein
MFVLKFYSYFSGLTGKYYEHMQCLLRQNLLWKSEFVDKLTVVQLP